ncbi:MAG TPA: polysaccharide deacetylase family protein [Actinomycetota bacterium]|nr:polysaccharide deacetylase family protein [Actinomycetota bacterium]
MNRRRFLGFLGAGALGGLSAGHRPPLRTGDARDVRGTDLTDEQVDRPPSGLQRVIWSVETKLPVAALTFDDGPDPEFTPRILDILERYDVRASFMVMAHNAIRHPGLLRRMVSAGHEIGGHGWEHLNLAEVGVREARREIEAGTKRIEDLAERRTRVFRPPYGRFSEAAVQLLANSRRDLIVWSVTRGDLGWQDPALIASHVEGATGPGDIVDLHDGIGRGTFNRGSKIADRIRRRRSVEVEALPAMIERIRGKGLQLETVSKLISVGDLPPSR